MNVVWHDHESAEPVKLAFVLACQQGLNDHRGDLRIPEPNRSNSGAIRLAIESMERLPGRFLWLLNWCVRLAVPGQRSVQAPCDKNEGFSRMPMRQPSIIELLAIGRRNCLPYVLFRHSLF